MKNIILWYLDNIFLLAWNVNISADGTWDLYIPIWRCFLSLKRNFTIWLHKILHLRQQAQCLRTEQQVAAEHVEYSLFFFQTETKTHRLYLRVITEQTLSNHWQNGKERLEFRNGVLTSTMALGRSSALNSCSIESIMFFQPSLRMLPCRWARSNTVLAAVCALLLLPNTVGRFSTDCRERGHTNTNNAFTNMILVVLVTGQNCVYIHHIIVKGWKQNIFFRPSQTLHLQFVKQVTEEAHLYKVTKQ